MATETSPKDGVPTIETTPREGRSRWSIVSSALKNDLELGRWRDLLSARDFAPRHQKRLLGLVLLFAVVFSIGPVGKACLGWKNKDYSLWYRTGRIMFHGGAIYPTDHRPFKFMYPPSAAALLALGSAAGEAPMVVGLVLINTAAWVATVLLAVYLATGRSLRRNPLLYALPSLMVIPFLNDTYLLGQPNLLLLALMLGAFACLRVGRDSTAGALIAFAAAIKAFPVMALGYLVYRRQWKATIASVVVLAGSLLVLPMPFRGPEKAWSDLATWTRGMVLKYDSDQIAQRPERSYGYKNSSMIALANRLLRPVPADGESKDGWRVNVASLNFRAVNTVIATVGLGLCLYYVATMPRSSRRSSRSDAIEQAMLLVLILLFSPLSFNYFYLWLIYPMTLALQLALESPEGSRSRRILWAWCLTPPALLALSVPFLRESQAYGNLVVAGLVLLIGLGLALRKSGVETPVVSSETANAAPMGRLWDVSRRRSLARSGLIGGLIIVGGWTVISTLWYDWFEKRVSVVVPGHLVRGAWQRPGPLRRIIERENIKTIVTLATVDSDPYRYLAQAGVATETGARWVFVPMVGSSATLEQMAEAADLLADPKNQPVLFHCVAGHHRTSLAHAAYRIRHEGWSAEQAWAELIKYRWTRPTLDKNDHHLIEQFAAHQSEIRPSRQAFEWSPAYLKNPPQLTVGGDGG